MKAQDMSYRLHPTFSHRSLYYSKLFLQNLSNYCTYTCSILLFYRLHLSISQYPILSFLSLLKKKGNSYFWGAKNAKTKLLQCITLYYYNVLHCLEIGLYYKYELNGQENSPFEKLQNHILINKNIIETRSKSSNLGVVFERGSYLLSLSMLVYIILDCVCAQNLHKQSSMIKKYHKAD